MLLLCATQLAYAQENTLYNHYFLNPYLYNPSLVAPDLFTEFAVNYRKQWSGIEGAPQTATFNFQLPFDHKTALGVWASNEKIGLFTVNTGLVTFRHQVYLGDRIASDHKIGFGLSIGMVNSKLDITKASNPADPLITNFNTWYFSSQFGMNYQYKDFRLAFAIPQILQKHIVSNETFNNPAIDRLRTTVSSISYNFHFGPRAAFEPYVLYRTTKGLPAQYEGLGVLRVDEKYWIGGGYRVDYGASAFLGFTIKDQIRVGYAYEFAAASNAILGNGTHEFQLMVRLGKKKTRPEPTIPPVDEPVVTQQQPQEVKNDPPATVKETPRDTATVVVTNQQPPVVQQTQPETQPQRLETPHLVKPTTDTTKLQPGYYVVVGVFASEGHAKEFQAAIKKAGFNSTVEHYPTRDFHFVHVGHYNALPRARVRRDEYRAKSDFSFRDTWVLKVE